MKLLKIDGSIAQFLTDSGQYNSVEKITKEDILRLANLTLEQDVDFDSYDESSIKNHAQQIVYRSVFEKLHGLKGRRQEFLDESKRLYLKDYERYREDCSQESTRPSP